MLKEPIIIYEHGDLMVFRLVQKAEEHLEPIDIENNEYVGFDSEGRKLKFLLVDKSRKIFKIFDSTYTVVKIVTEDNTPSGKDELREILIQSLNNYTKLEDDVSLPELVELAIAKFGYTNNNIN